MMTRLGLALLWLIHWLPFGMQVRLGEGLGNILYRIALPRRRIAEINIQHCFPELSAMEQTRLVRAHFRSVARAALEHGVLWWGSAQRIQQWVSVEGREHYDALAGQPVILLSPHFVGLDMGAIRLTLDYPPAVSIYSRLRNPVIDRLMLRARSRFSQTILVSRHDGVRPLLKAMKRGHHLLYLPDQDFGPRDAMFVPFFGIPAATINALPRLAAMTGARVVPLITRQLPGNQGYVVRFHPAWDNFPGTDLAADLARINAFIETQVREMPEQYFWLHKRFKTRPTGEPSFYA